MNPPARSRNPLADSSRRLLVVYRILALSTATLLIVLVFVGIPLQVVAHQAAVVSDVGTLHGFVYIVYVVVAFALTRRLALPKWQMILVLLAGTVPFCGFVAERKMTRRFESTFAHPEAVGGRAVAGARGAAFRRRWLSPRALVLHLELVVVAPGCAAAGWWQATRALSGNTLSWIYSIEWPIFSVIALVVWWHLVHEDPEAYRARRTRSASREDLPTPGPHPAVTPIAGDGRAAMPAAVVSWSAALAALVGADLVAGVLAVVAIPLGRPRGWLPAQGEAVYLVHAAVGGLLAIGAAAMVVRARGCGRIPKLASWLGAVCVATSGLGGLLTVEPSLVRLLGMALMGAGSVLAGCCYLIPVAVRAKERSVASVLAGGADGEPATAQ